MSATARRTSWISRCSSHSLRGASIAGPCCLPGHHSPCWSRIIGLPTKSIRLYPNKDCPHDHPVGFNFYLANALLRCQTPTLTKQQAARNKTSLSRKDFIGVDDFPPPRPTETNFPV